MNIKLKNSKVQKFQMGGPMQSAEEPTQTGGAPVQEQAPEQEMEQEMEQDPIAMLAQMSAQAIQSQDCQMAMQVCQAFLEIMQQMQGGAPEEPQGEPVFRKGGVLVRRIKK